MADLVDLMQKTVAQAETHPQKQRAAALARAFDYYHLTWQLYHEDQAGSHSPQAQTPAEALQFIDRGVRALTQAQERRRMVLQEFAGDPILVQPWDIERASRLRGADWGSDWLWKAADFAAHGDQAVLAKLRALSDSPVDSISQTANDILAQSAHGN